MGDVQPFKISIPGVKIQNLKERLAAATFPDELDDAGRDLGPPLKEVKHLAQYWKDGFDWRKAESKLNQLPQFRTPIQVEGFEPLSIHFVHQPSSVPGAIPLLFIHGWPGSFIEVESILPLLGKGDGKKTPAFHVVALSLPNYGFSEGPKKRNFRLAQYAETCVKLMQKLSYPEFVVQGGDWGSHIARTLSALFPDQVRAIHINMVRAKAPSVFRNPLLALKHQFTPYSARDQHDFRRQKWFHTEGQGYSSEQATRPQTLGYALADSPVGLLAWIYEKLVEWTDNYPWTDDEVLTWVSIYWFSTAGPAASLRIYYERLHDPTPHQPWITMEYIPKVKLGLAFFPMDLDNAPSRWGRTLGPVVHQSVFKKGGHFAATERPDDLAADVIKMYGRGGGAFGVVKGKNGYSQAPSRPLAAS